MDATGAALGREYVLTLCCPDRPGIVYAVSSFLVQHSGNILASQQYGESPGALPFDIVGVVSNDDTFGELAASYRLPFRHLPVTAGTKAAAEAGRDVEAQVLARAVTWHAEHRVLPSDGRTVVFH